MNFDLDESLRLMVGYYERRTAERRYEADKMFCPDYRPVLLTYMVNGNA